MLDEDEFAPVSELLTQGTQAVKTYRENHDVPLGEVDRPACFARAIAAFKEITGFEETNPDAIYHHRLSLYGPPCCSCAKPLRTAQAHHCAECGVDRDRFREEVRIDTGRGADKKAFVRVSHLPTGKFLVEEGIEEGSVVEVHQRLIEELRTQIT